MKFLDYKDFYKDMVKHLMSIDSPTGFTQTISKDVFEYIKDMGYQVERTNLGNVIVTVDGKDNSKSVGLSAHLDTLGLMVKSISPAGEIRFVPIGSPLIPTLDGEYCKIYTKSGKVYTGTISSLSPAKHVFPDAMTRPRNENEMYVRLDEEVYSAEDVKKLGIESGDFICYDTKTIFTENGYLKSRFIDDKACSAILLTILKAFKEKNIVPDFKTYFCFVVNEEIGYGGATLPRDMEELLIVDMGCIGLDLSCKETDVSICVKDSMGAYDYDMTKRLMEIAKENSIDYAADIYPMYFSDAMAALKAGYDTRCALIGPGVCASHGMERTHLKGIENTFNLILKYIVG